MPFSIISGKSVINRFSFENLLFFFFFWSKFSFFQCYSQEKFFIVFQNFPIIWGIFFTIWSVALIDAIFSESREFLNRMKITKNDEFLEICDKMKLINYVYTSLQIQCKSSENNNLRVHTDKFLKIIDKSLSFTLSNNLSRNRIHYR